jgi:CheY-like chemotaxis protein
LVQRLVELHGGSVEAHSILGQGSEFVVRLPAMPLLLTALPEPSAPANDRAPPPKKASSGCRVLVVDDNIDAAQSMAKLLEMTGQETRLAYDGPSALQAALDYRPDLVLLDIGLPGLDGYEVAERIRQQDTLKHTVLVALTGYGQDSDRQRSQDTGFDHHLTKPADFDEIENILTGIVLLRKT